MDHAQVPGSVAHREFLHVSKAGGNFETNAFQAQGAIAATLGSGLFLCECQSQLLRRRAGLGDVFIVEKTIQRSLACFRVDLAIILQFDPGQRGFVELVQSQINHAFEHGQKPPFDLAPKRLLLPILIRGICQCVFKVDAQTSEPLLGFSGDHGRTVVKKKGSGQIPLLKRLAATVAEFPGSFGQIPLEMAAEPGMVVEYPQQNGIHPLAVDSGHTQGAVMEIQMPEPVDIFVFIAADLPRFITALGDLGSRTVGRAAPGPLEQPVVFHITQDRDIRRLGIC